MQPHRPWWRPLAAVLKSFTMRWTGRATRAWSAVSGRSRVDYAALVGDGTGNAAVMATVLWLCRTFPEAPIRVLRPTGDGEEAIPDHPLVLLLRRPNPHYSGLLLWMATLADWMTTGNAYWIKVRSGSRRVVELWWVPAGLIAPAWPDDGSAYISHYTYSPGGDTIRLDPADVVHFRYGLDPANTRLGRSPLASLLREIFTDDEAANFSASLLRNLGVPGVILSPDDDQGLTQEEADAVKGVFETRFGADNRGRAMVTLGKMKAQMLSFSPQQMDLKALRRLPEERVTAVLGVPAVVVGLGAGLDRSTFSNMREAREAAYESNVIPTQRLMAADLEVQLLADFGGDASLSIGFDLTQVRVLQDDQNALAVRAALLYEKGIITRGQARAMVGQPVGPDDDVYVTDATAPATAAPALMALPPGEADQPGPSLDLPAAGMRAASGAAGAMETRAAALVPVGGDRALRPVPIARVEVADLEEASARWDDLLVTVAGLLDASVEEEPAAAAVSAEAAG